MINDNVDKNDDIVEPEEDYSIDDITRIRQFIIRQARRYIVTLKNFLIDTVMHFYVTLPAQFSTFDKKFMKFINTLDVEKEIRDQKAEADDFLNVRGIELAFKKNIKIFVVDFINSHIRNAANAIYRILGEMLIPDSSILVFTPSHLITKSVLVAGKCNPQLSVTIVNTKHNLSRDQLQTFVQHDIRCSFINLMHLPFLLMQNHFDKCLIGALHVSKNGNVSSRGGSRTLAILCKLYHIPLIAVAESIKFSDEECMANPLVSMQLNDEDDVAVEVVDSTDISAIVCEQGIFQPTSIMNRK